jgi:hypothetical protein
VAISTHFHAGADPEQARAVYPYYHEYLRPKRPGGRGFVVDRAAFDAGVSPQGAIMAGSAAEVTDKLLGVRKTLGLDRIFAQVNWGGLPAALVEETIARYATEIAPPCARPERPSRPCALPGLLASRGARSFTAGRAIG